MIINNKAGKKERKIDKVYERDYWWKKCRKKERNGSVFSSARDCYWYLLGGKHDE